MDVTRIREQIPVCQAMTYVNTGWSGPSPKPVVDAIKDRLDYEMNQGPTTPEVYLSGQEIQNRAQAALAELVNAAPDEICITRNTTEGLNIVINGLPWQQGDEIITCDLEHSSVWVPALFQQQRHGAVVKVVSLAPNENQESILEKMEAAISDRTKLVFLSHVQYSSGLRMPVEQIRGLTKEKGALMLLDGAQAAGQVSLDMADLDCDFYSLPGQKWLLGPEGVGALYIRRNLIPQVEPIHVGGRSVVSFDDPYSFEPDPSSINKFVLSSVSVPLYAGLVETIRFIQEIGVKQIEERNLDLAEAMKGALNSIPGVRVLSPLTRSSSSGLVSFSVEGVNPGTAVARLWEDHRIVARAVQLPSSIRLSLHFFNTEEEVERVAEAVRELV
jgi:L-cysteine/cystine lyase